jgi:hypothetical protein
MSDDFKPFIIERPGPNGRIRLNADARHWAKEHGMSLTEMAKYLLAQNEQEGLEAPELPEPPELPTV